MPYKEIGKEYPFEKPAKIPMGFLVESECLSGFTSYQSAPGTTTINIDSIDLSVVKNAIESAGKVRILFMKLSWNVGAQITDLVFGAVWITKKSVTAKTVLESTPSNLMTVLNDLRMIQREDFDAYIDGEVTHENVWEWKGETEEVHKEKVTIGQPSSFPYESVKQVCEITILSKATEEIQRELGQFNPQITKIEPHTEIETTRWDVKIGPIYTWHTEYRHKLKMSAKVYFTTEQSLIEPLGLKIPAFIIAALVKIVISLAIITAAALVIMYAWGKFVESFLVKENTITEKTTTVIKTPIFDEEGNIIGYEETTIIEEREEKQKEPSIIGQVITAAAVVMGSVGVTSVIAAALTGREEKR